MSNEEYKEYIIEMIQKENDIKNLDHTQTKELAEEIPGISS